LPERRLKSSGSGAAMASAAAPDSPSKVRLRIASEPAQF